MHDDRLHPIGCQKFNLLSLPILSELKWKQRRPPKTLAWASKKGSRMGGGNRREWPYMPLFPPYLQKIMLMKDIPICVIPSTSLNIHPIHFLFFLPHPVSAFVADIVILSSSLNGCKKPKRKTSKVGQPFFTQRKKKTMAPNIIPNSLSTSSTDLPYLDLMWMWVSMILFFLLHHASPSMY